MSKRVVFLGMGGTIAGRATTASDNVGYRAGEVPVNEILEAVPGLAALLGGTQLHSEQVAQIDSKDMRFEDMARLAQRLCEHLEDNAVVAAVVTHGTDTLEETAFFLHCVIPHSLLSQKAVVMTCAMRPATALSPDGPGNLLDATAVALDPRARGVLVAAAGSIHGAQQVQKVHPYRLDAFNSGEAGPLGFVEEGRVRWVAQPVVSAGKRVPQKGQLVDSRWPRVEIVMNHVGATGASVRALCRPTTADGDALLRGIIVAGTGNGTISQDLEEALLQAQASGVRVVRVSRCQDGVVVTSAHAVAAIETMPYSAVKARIALMLDLLSAEVSH